MGEEMKYALNSVSVDSWGSKKDGNDCWWNIAKNQLVQSGVEKPSNAQIVEKMNEIKEYNEKKRDKQISLDDYIYDGDEIFIPIEDSIDEIQGKVESLNTEYGELTDSYGKQTDELGEINTQVGTDLTKLNDAKAALDKFNGEDDMTSSEYRQALSDYNTALADYQQSVKDQKDKQSELEKTKTDMNQKKEDIDSAKEELVGLQDELLEAKEENQETIDKLQAEIDALDGQVETKEQEIEQAKEKQAQEDAKATASQEQAKELGALDENGNVTDKWEPDAEKLSAAASSIKTENPNNDENAEITKAVADKLKETLGNDVNLDDAKIESSGQFTTYTLKDGSAIQLKDDGEGNLVETIRIVHGEDDSFIKYESVTSNTGEESTHVNKYTVGDDGKEQPLSYESFAQAYTKPEDLKEENLTKKIEYSYDDKGNKTTAVITYEKDGIEAGNTSEPDAEYWDKVKSQEYNSEYLGGLIDEYDNFAKASATTEDKAKAAEIKEQIDAYVEKVDSLSKVDDADYAEFLKNNEIDLGAAYIRYVDRAAENSDGEDITSADKNFEKYQEVVKMAYEAESAAVKAQKILDDPNTSATQKLVIREAQELLEGRKCKDMTSFDPLTNIYGFDNSTYDSSVNDASIDSAYNNAIGNIEFYSQPYNDIVENSQLKDVSNQDVVKLKDAYDRYMSLDGHKNGGDVVNSAEEILLVYYAGAASSGGDIDTLIQSLNNMSDKLEK